MVEQGGKSLIFLFSFSLLTSFFSCRIPNSKCMFCCYYRSRGDVTTATFFFRFCVVALIACLFLESQQQQHSQLPNWHVSSVVFLLVYQTSSTASVIHSCKISQQNMRIVKLLRLLHKHLEKRATGKTSFPADVLVLLCHSDDC